MTRSIHSSTEAPAAIGPYSQAVEAEPFVYLSGQTPLDPASGVLVTGDVETQTRRCFQNLFAVLASAGLGPEHVVKVNVYLVDMNDFEAMNRAYSEAFDAPYPARTTVAVAALPKAAQVEIELVARRP
jgi:2-iminobutanoate/2-iminopropanoate deaminase